VHPDVATARDAVRGGLAVFAHFSGFAGMDMSAMDGSLRQAAEQLRAGDDLRGHGRSDAGHAQALDAAFIDRFGIVGPIETVVPRFERLAALGLRGVIGGDVPLLAGDRALVALEPSTVLLSALKPAEEGEGIVLRLLNPTDHAATARVRLALPVQSAEAVRLDETPLGETVRVDAGVLQLPLPPHALRSVLLR
jgi:hypothetical protein